MDHPRRAPAEIIDLFDTMYSLERMSKSALELSCQYNEQYGKQHKLAWDNVDDLYPDWKGKRKYFNPETKTIGLKDE